MNPLNFELLVVRRTPTRLVNPVLKQERSNRNESNVKTRMNSVLGMNPVNKSSTKAGMNPMLKQEWIQC